MRLTVRKLSQTREWEGLGTRLKQCQIHPTIFMIQVMKTGRSLGMESGDRKLVVSMMQSYALPLYSMLAQPGQVYMYRWFSWGVASLLEGKSWGLCLVQLYAKYRQKKRYIESLPSVLKDKRSYFSQNEMSAVQLVLSARLSSGSRMLN